MPRPAAIEAGVPAADDAERSDDNARSQPQAADRFTLVRRAPGRLRSPSKKGEVVSTPPPSPQHGPTLTDTYEAWKAGRGARGSRKPSGRTLLEAERSVRLLKG